MASISDYLENALLDHVLNNTALSSPVAVYVALYTDDPTDADVGTEVTGGSYARTQATFDAAAGGNTQNNNNITFPTATANWGTVTHIGVHDAVSGGNLLFHAPLASSKTIETNDIFEIKVGFLVVDLD
jgi:hypothetical protein